MKDSIKNSKKETGQALIIVTIVMLLAGLLIPPLMQMTAAGERGAHVRENRMLELYAADAGIQNTLYRSFLR